MLMVEQGYIVKTRLLTNQKRARNVLDYRFITQHQALLMITHPSPCFTLTKPNSPADLDPATQKTKL